MTRNPSGPRPSGQGNFQDLDATALFCPLCRTAMPVKKRLLLVLPDGEKYEYLCARCGTSVGEKMDRVEPKKVRVVV